MEGGREMDMGMGGLCRMEGLKVQLTVGERQPTDDRMGRWRIIGHR